MSTCHVPFFIFSLHNKQVPLAIQEPRVRCWACHELIDRNQRLLTCKLQHYDAKQARNDIANFLAFDPARGINVHGLAVFMLRKGLHKKWVSSLFGQLEPINPISETSSDLVVKTWQPDSK